LERRLDGGGHELRSFRVDDDVPAEQKESASPTQTVSVAEGEHPPSGRDGTFGAAEYAGRAG
jgi:hypothetical protein